MSGPNVRWVASSIGRYNVARSLSADTRPSARSRKFCASISGISGRSRKRNRVAHVGEARNVSNGALEAEAKTRVRYRTVAAQISVPAIVLFIDAALRHACI